MPAQVNRGANGAGALPRLQTRFLKRSLVRKRASNKELHAGFAPWTLSRRRSPRGGDGEKNS